MSWEPEIEELRRREALAREMGGPEKVERQRAAGRLNVRERIAALLDPESFHEIGAIAGAARYDESGDLAEFRPANFVMGRGRIEGRPAAVAADDFTVRGGAADAAIFQKQIFAEQMAHDLRVPMVRMVDGTGGGGSVKSLETMGMTYVPFNPGLDWIVRNLGEVPVVSLALGPCAGLGAMRVVASHYSAMVTGISQVFVAGPPLVAHLGEVVDKEALGGAGVHARNGVVDDVVGSEAEAFERARRFLSYLPASVHDLPPRGGEVVDVDGEWLTEAIPRDRRTPYKIRRIISSVVDGGSFFEIGAGWGRSAVCGLARVDGWPLAIIASDPYHYAGGWTAEASRKVTRLVDLADTFHLPVVHFVDQPGFVIGSAAERAGTIRHGTHALFAIEQAQVPWCSIILRKSYGVAGGARFKLMGFSFRYAWPSGDWGSLPLEGGIEAAYKAMLGSAEDPEALRAEIEKRLEQVRSPFRTAEAFLIEEIIDPRDTRRYLREFATLAAPLRQSGPRANRMRP